MNPKRAFVIVTVAAAIVLASSACKAPQAFGDRHAIIVRADSALWLQVESDVMAALEQRAYTTRPERIFKVTFVAANDTLWEELRLWHQLIVLGTREDEVVASLLHAAESGDAAPPAIVETGDKWARAQLIYVLSLPEQGQAAAVDQLLPDLYDRLRARYDEWIIERMYTTGLNDSLKQALAVDGFTLDLPRVYRFSRLDTLFRFGNPYRQGDTDLLRSIILTWRTGAGPTSPDSLLAWRETIDEAFYDPAQDVLEEGFRDAAVDVGGLTGVELRGVWQDRSDFPAAGPFITRAIACPSQNRTYYIDAWLFAPGKDKYPYLRQLELVLDSFRCVG